jgi:hypothetical protein
MENETSKNLKTMHRNKQHMAILEEYIRNIENPKERKTSSSTNIFLPQKSVEREPERVIENLNTMKTEVASPPVVDIKDVAIKKEGSQMKVNFRVVNLRELDNPIGGYIHLIAVGKDGYSPSAWTFPNEELRDGVPVDFRRGQLFLIQRFKPIEGNFYLSSIADPPSAVKVLVGVRGQRWFLIRCHPPDHYCFHYLLFFLLVLFFPPRHFPSESISSIFPTPPTN